MSTPEAAPGSSGAVGQGTPSWAERARVIASDWWVTIVAGAIVAAAVAGVLPKFPW